MTRSTDGWRRAAPAARLGRPSITSWTGPSYTSEQLIEGLRERLQRVLRSWRCSRARGFAATKHGWASSFAS